MTTATAPSPQEWKDLLDAALEFKQLACWEWMYDADMFGVKNPEGGEIGYCCVMGRGGESFGLALYPGTDGLACIQSLFDGVVQPEDKNVIYSMKSLVASFEDRALLAKKDVQILKDLGLKFRGRNAWPQFRSYLPGYVPWYLTAPEARFMTAALGQAMEVAQRFRTNENLLTPDNPDQYLVRVPTVQEGQTTWRDEYLEPAPLPPKGNGVAIDEARLRRIRDSLPVSESVWEVDFFFMPTPIAEGERPYFPIDCLWMDHQSGLILSTCLSTPWEYRAEFVGEFVKLLEGGKFLPRTIMLQREEAMDLFGPILQPLGITVAPARRLRVLEDAKKELLRCITRLPL